MCASEFVDDLTRTPDEMKWIRLNWARRTSWGWWDEWDDTVLQTQDSKFEPWRSEAEHATSRSRRLPTILTFTRGWGRNIFVSFKPPRPGTEPRTLSWKAAVLTTTLGPPPNAWWTSCIFLCASTSAHIFCTLKNISVFTRVNVDARRTSDQRQSNVRDKWSTRSEFVVFVDRGLSQSHINDAQSTHKKSS